MGSQLTNTSDAAELPDRPYRLFAVVVHVGSGPHHGHYVALVRRHLARTATLPPSRPPSHIWQVPLTGSLADGRLPGVKHKLTLPLLPRILAAGHAHGSGTYLIYSNLDIALQLGAVT